MAVHSFLTVNGLRKKSEIIFLDRLRDIWLNIMLSSISLMVLSLVRKLVLADVSILYFSQHSSNLPISFLRMKLSSI